MSPSKTNEYIKRKWGKSQIELAKAIAKKRGDITLYNSYKGYVNKWFHTDQEPGKDYLLELSEILGVPVEAILRGEDIDFYPYNHPTSYLAAITADEAMINKLFGFEAGEEGIRVTTTDEYGKSFMRYVVEFRNYKALAIAIRNNHCPLFPYRDNWDWVSREFEDDVLSMIIENDDLKLFLMMVSRYTAFVDEGECIYMNGYTEHDYSASHCIPRKFADEILESDKIFKWYLNISPLNDEEKKKINRGLTKESDDNLKISSINAGFNYLLQCAIEQQNLQKIQILLDSAEKCLQQLKNALGKKLELFNIVTDDMKLTDGNHPYYSAFMPYVEKVDSIKDETLKKRAKEINRQIEQIKENCTNHHFSSRLRGLRCSLK